MPRATAQSYVATPTMMLRRMPVWLPDSFNRITEAWLARAAVTGVLLLCAEVVAAQSAPSTAVTVVAGVALRGTGNMAACCGPAYQPDLKHVRSFWVGGGISRSVSPRLALDAELTWAREPEYRAYVQAALGDAPLRAYSSDNRVSSLTAAGLFRWHGWHKGTGAADLVGGLAWVHDHRVSHLESVIFRPLPNLPPRTTLDIADARQSVAAVFGVDLEASSGAVSIVAQGRFHLHFRGDALRSDLDPGRQVWRLGAGTRVRF